MNFVFPILAAVLQASSFTLDKVILSIRRVNFRTYTGVSYPLLFLITLIIFLVFRPPLSGRPLAGNLLWLLTATVGLSIGTNLIFYRALGDDQLGELQMIDLMGNVPIIVFASVIFTDERNVFVLVPALVASLAIIWSHWEHGHFRIRKYTRLFLIWSLAAMPLNASLLKILLHTWNPISLELVRTGAIALILGPLFAKYARIVSFRAFLLLVFTNILTSVAWILFYFSYQRSGVVYTILVFSLQPLLVYLAAAMFLKEKFQRKKSLAFGIVLISILIAQVIG